MGGMVMSPSIEMLGSFAAWRAAASSSSGAKPLLLSSPPMFTSNKTAWVTPCFSAWRWISSISSIEDTEWIKATLPTICRTLLRWRWPMKWRGAPS